jgi:hypothetical protein
VTGTLYFLAASRMPMKLALRSANCLYSGRLSFGVGDFDIPNVLQMFYSFYLVSKKKDQLPDLFAFEMLLLFTYANIF